MQRSRRIELALAWLAFASLQCLFIMLSERSGANAVSYIVFALLHGALWTAATPLVWAMIRALDNNFISRGRAVAAHLGALLLLSFLDAAWRRILWLMMGDRLTVPFGATMLYYADFTLVCYGAVVVAGRALDAGDRLAIQALRIVALRVQLARARLEALEAQIQPHFLFNSLGTVMELAHEAPSSAAAMLRQLAQLLRFSLDGAGRKVQLREELSALESFLDIQRVRFADWLVIGTDASEDSLDVAVPRLTLQPLVENAIRHGMSGRTGRGSILIDARCSSARLRLSVRDDGTGISSDAPRRGYGLGLTNVRARLECEYGSDFQFTLTSTGRGTVAEINIPAERIARAGASLEIVPSEPAVAHTILDALHRHPIRATIVGWTVWGALWLQQSVAYLRLRGRFHREALPGMLRDHASIVVLWALLTPLVVRCGRKWPLTQRHLWRNCGIHVMLACVFAVIHTMLWQATMPGTLRFLSPAFYSTLVWNVLLYAVLVGISQHDRLVRERTQREGARTELEAELEEARLQAASRAFQPHAALARLDELAIVAEHTPADVEAGVSELAIQMRAAMEAALQSGAALNLKFAGAA